MSMNMGYAPAKMRSIIRAFGLSGIDLTTTLSPAFTPIASVSQSPESVITGTLRSLVNVFFGPGIIFRVIVSVLEFMGAPHKQLTRSLMDG